MIRNPDGSEYKTSGSISQYEQKSLLPLFDLWDQEAIKQGGTKIKYYEIFISENEIDPLYIEARNKLFSPVPIELWAFYEPISSQNFISSLGWDSPDEIIFELNSAYTIKEIGHIPKIGAKIFTPHLSEYWEIIQRKYTEFKLWGTLRLQLVCRRFQDSTTTNSSNVPDIENKVKII
jgi:hypothetical protein